MTQWGKVLARLGAMSAVALLAQVMDHSARATWYDSATGQPVHVTPRGLGNVEASNQATIHDIDNKHARDLYWDNVCNTWRDSSNGVEVHVTPRGLGNVEGSNQATIHDIDNKHARDLYWVPCPPPEIAASTGLYLGGELVKNWGWVRSIERSAATDVVTNQFTDRADPVGGGFVVGYRFAPFAANIVVSPFASFDFMHAPVNHTFAGGSFLGTTANFMGTFGVKVGPQFDAFWLYGIGGVSVLNETLNINFLPVASSQSATVPGGTAGLGGAWRPSFLQGFGLPVSVFAEYQHFWWADANFNRPVASPLFNYTFRRQDDLLKIGFTVDLNPPPPPVMPSGPRYVKALPAK